MPSRPSHHEEPGVPAFRKGEPTKTAGPVLTRDAVRAVDRDAIEQYGIPSIVLMENAAIGLTAQALRMLEAMEDGAAPKRVAIICGSGNNGGDGYAMARHLHNAGVTVTVIALKQPRGGTDAAVNAQICLRMSIKRIDLDGAESVERAAGLMGEADLLVDALFGTGLDRPLEGDVAHLIETINASGRPVLAVDLPSGLDCDTGDVLGTAVRATATVTFVARKPCCERIDAQQYLGEVSVAPIGAPDELIDRHGQPQQHAHPHDDRRKVDHRP